MEDKLKNIIQRLLSAVIGIPALLAIIWFLPQYQHLALNVVVTIFGALGAREFAGILGKKSPSIRPFEAVLLSVLPITGMTLYVSAGWSSFTGPAAALIGVLYCLVRCALTPQDQLEKAGSRLAAGLSAILYPGVCLGCMILIANLPYSTTLLMTFLCIPLANDSAAWLFGMLFGKNNRGIIAASPNKSIAGFVGGFFGSLLVCVTAAFLKPEPFTMLKCTPLLTGLILGTVTSLSATVGDLAESALKRSSGVKDSGGIMPGRGGILDSIDSLAFAAPVFYLVYKILKSL